MPSAACSVTAAASASAPSSTGPPLSRARDVDGVQHGQQPQRVGHHAVIELHRQRILEQLRHAGAWKNRRALSGMRLPSISGQVL